MVLQPVRDFSSLRVVLPPPPPPPHGAPEAECVPRSRTFRQQTKAISVVAVDLPPPIHRLARRTPRLACAPPREAFGYKRGLRGVTDDDGVQRRRPVS